MNLGSFQGLGSIYKTTVFLDTINEQLEIESLKIPYKRASKNIKSLGDKPNKRCVCGLAESISLRCRFSPSRSVNSTQSWSKSQQAFCSNWEASSRGSAKDLEQPDHFLQKLHLSLSTPEYLSNICPHNNVYENVHGSFIANSPNQEITQRLSAGEWLKQPVVYLYDGILLESKKE